MQYLHIIWLKHLLPIEVLKMKDKYKIKAKSINEGDELSRHIAELDPEGQEMMSFLQESTLQTQALVNAFEGYIFICTHDHRIVYMNE